jgi:integrase
VYIGPKAQAVIADRLTGGYVFSPRTAWQEESDKRKNEAKPKYPSWVKKGPRLGPPVKVKEYYTPGAYRLAVVRGCRRAKVAAWAPNQLRHAALTEIREKHGLEAAQVRGGHKHTSTTERYARPTSQPAIESAEDLG